MSGHPDKIAEHYRESRGRRSRAGQGGGHERSAGQHYVMAAEYWRLAQTAEDEVIE